MVCIQCSEQGLFLVQPAEVIERFCDILVEICFDLTVVSKTRIKIVNQSDLNFLSASSE